jgi:hypothetical protein
MTYGVGLKSEPLGDRSVLLARLGEGNLGSEGLLGRLLDGKGLGERGQTLEQARLGGTWDWELGRRGWLIRMARKNGESRVVGAVRLDGGVG